MERLPLSFLRRAALGVTFATGFALSAVAIAAPPAAAPAGPTTMAAAFSRHVQWHLDNLADRLEIQASQEPAWQTFEAALRNVMTFHWKMMTSPVPGPDTNAATIARLRADRAAEQARNLDRLAKATAGLRQVLTTNQREVLDEVASRYAGHRFGHCFGPMMRGHGGMGMGPGMGPGMGWGPGARSGCAYGDGCGGPMSGPMSGPMGGAMPGAASPGSAAKGNGATP